MKVLDKSPEGTILKVSEQEIYLLGVAVNHHAVACERVWTDDPAIAICNDLFDTLEKAVYDGKANSD